MLTDTDNKLVIISGERGHGIRYRRELRHMNYGV